MFVPCPHCGFLIAQALKDGATPARCPRCRAALGDAASSPPGPATSPPDPAPSPDAAATPPPPSSAPPASAPAPAPQRPGPEGAGPAVVAPPATRTAARAHGPSFARVRIDQLAAAPRWPAVLALLSLSLLLAIQLLLAQRAELATRAAWRPLLDVACTVFRCELPPWHEPTAYVMLDRSVRPVPDQPGLLRVNASFRNDARWPQAWPTLLLTLSDADGRRVGQRAFRPDEYRREHAPEETLSPGQSTTVAFEVVEPAAHIVAYSFDFR